MTGMHSTSKTKAFSMARKVEVELLDDIDGSEAAETLAFGLDGTNYEIDVNEKHADKLRKSLEKFVMSARRVGRGGVAVSRRRTAGVHARTDRAQNQAIRDWAKRKKIQLSDRGRIPANVVAQYEAEAGR
jgi:hypothetical protein